MKRSVLLISLVFVLSQVSCSGVIDDITMQRVILTLTATAHPPAPASTPSPFERLFVQTINMYLQQHEDPLSRTLDATYTVVDAHFISNDFQIPIVFSVTIECECSHNGTCCTVEHTFVVLSHAMKANVNVFLGIQPNNTPIPQTVSEFRVSCYDDKNLDGTLSVPWSTMFAYLMGIDDGSQLGWNVHPYETPKP